ncbi:MAG TPA: hypothetical protein DCZ13_03920, partial [Porticoccaceae bacterium]|nr:hypothetical protein [Porticoccaceae bacterium]
MRSIKRYTGRGLVGVALAFSFALTCAAETLHVAAGKTRELGSGYADRVFDELILEDNATLILSSEVKDWSLEARSAKFGRKSRIVALGVEGARGADGNSATGKPGACRNGESGGHAAHGIRGGDGASLTLRVGIAQLNSLPSPPSP